VIAVPAVVELEGMGNSERSHQIVELARPCGYVFESILLSRIERDSYPLQVRDELWDHLNRPDTPPPRDPAI
jgi:hypothetical protein